MLDEQEDSAPRIGFVGASPDTGNLGVSALCMAGMRGLFNARPQAELVVFDEGRGCRDAQFKSNGQSFPYKLCGEKFSRRYWQAESLWNIRVSSWLGGLSNASARQILNADAILDVSGGDSFTDLYGPKRFAAVTMFKRIVLDCDTPLILLPQTYGPFVDPGRRRRAAEIVKRSQMAWARDARSFEAMKDLLGSAFDPDRHRSGVDMAFELEACTPDSPFQQMAEEWTANENPVAGINVSGLIFNSEDGGEGHYQLKADYKVLIIEFVRRLLEHSDCHVVLVPHVITPVGHFESDAAACNAVLAAVGERADGRVTVLPILSDPREVKWMIARMNWFCGTRMHSTIAALSSGVPTAAIAYSLKTAGVFETCGQGDYVVDPRKLDTADALEMLWACWSDQNKAAARLAECLPAVKDQAVEQMKQVMNAVSNDSHSQIGARSGKW